jgi:hypothetical protein
MAVAHLPDSAADKYGHRQSGTPQSEVPARCPDWCTVADHSDTACTEDVLHVGPKLSPIEVQGQRVLGVEVFAFTNSDGCPEDPLAYVRPCDDGDEGEEMAPNGLRELARRVHAQAAAIEALADQLQRMRR